MERFVEAADKGVIIFSLGFIYSTLQQYHLKVINNVECTYVSCLEQRVIAKLEYNIPQHEVVPSNVWVPQQALLSHPKTILFFSHCGAWSQSQLYEAVWHEVPLYPSMHGNVAGPDRPPTHGNGEI